MRTRCLVCVVPLKFVEIERPACGGVCREISLCDSLCYLCGESFSSNFTTETQRFTEFAQRKAFSDRLRSRRQHKAWGGAQRNPKLESITIISLRKRAAER